MKLSDVINWDLIPHSRARNSYNLLKDVQKAILTEPRRVYMDTWNGLPNVFDNDGEPFGAFSLCQFVDFPECGTVGCISGWMNLLSASKLETLKTGFQGMRHTAGVLLPPSIDKETNKLCFGREDGDYPFPPSSTNQGTLAYAQHVVENIQRFLDKHEEVLKAHRLPARS